MPVVVTHNGTDYPCPLSERFRRHTPEELDRLAASIEEQGVVNPVLLFENADELGALSVLDGEGRLTAAERAGVSVPFRKLGYMSVEAAYSIALGLNDARRHDTPGAITQRRRERIALARELRAEKRLSIADIAERFGVSEAQVRRDLEAGGGDPLAKDKPPEADPDPDNITPDMEFDDGDGVPRTVGGRDGPADDRDRKIMAIGFGREWVRNLSGIVGEPTGRELRKALGSDGKHLFRQGEVKNNTVWVAVGRPLEVVQAIEMHNAGGGGLVLADDYGEPLGDVTRLWEGKKEGEKE